NADGAADPEYLNVALRDQTPDFGVAQGKTLGHISDPRSWLPTLPLRVESQSDLLTLVTREGERCAPSGWALSYASRYRAMARAKVSVSDAPPPRLAARSWSNLLVSSFSSIFNLATRNASRSDSENAVPL